MYRVIRRWVKKLHWTSLMLVTFLGGSLSILRNIGDMAID